MSAIINTEIRLDKIIDQGGIKSLIKKNLFHDKVRTFDTKDGKGAAISVSVKPQDEIKYDSNAYTIIAQDKEEREAKEDHVSLGSGRVVWTNGVIKSFYDLKDNQEGSGQLDSSQDLDSLPEDAEADLPF